MLLFLFLQMAGASSEGLGDILRRKYFDKAEEGEIQAFPFNRMDYSTFFSLKKL